MLSRQRTILRMLASAGPTRNKLDLAKLQFLLAEEHPSLPRTTLHEFVPYRRGPYSFTLAYDLSSLERDGLVRQGLSNVTVTQRGLAEAEETAIETWMAVDKVKARHGKKDRSELVDYFFEAYAWYTLNGKWEDLRDAEHVSAQVAIYTTGYEGITLDGLLDRLLKTGIQRLIDVRANPVARRFGFHKSTLARICPKLGIDYVHIPEVGVPSKWRSDLESPQAYRTLFERYEREVLPKASSALMRLEELIASQPSALMCKETDPLCCHRTTLAHALAQRMGLPVQDLGPINPNGTQ